MKKIIINTPSQESDGTTDWLQTMLTVQGLPINSAFTHIMAVNLPGKYMPALMGVVQHLIAVGEDDGGKRCEEAEAWLMTLPAEYDTPDEGDPVEIEPERQVVKLYINWQWDDGHIASETVTLEAPEVVTLVKYLLTETTYKKS